MKTVAGGYVGQKPLSREDAENLLKEIERLRWPIDQSWHNCYQPDSCVLIVRPAGIVAAITIEFHDPIEMHQYAASLSFGSPKDIHEGETELHGLMDKYTRIEP